MTKKTEVTVNEQRRDEALVKRLENGERHVVPQADIYESPDAFV